MGLDYRDIESIIIETYEIRKEKKGILFTRTVEVEKPIRRKKENYKNGKLVSYEEVFKSFDGRMIRLFGEIKLLQNEGNKETKKFYCASTNKLIKSEEHFRDKNGNIYSSIYQDYESRFFPFSSWSYENIYDSRGRLIQSKSYHSKELSHISTYKYDAAGNCTKKISQSYSEGINYKEDINNYTNDSSGNHIRAELITHYKQRLKYHDGEDNIEVMEWERNEYGDVIHTKWNRNGSVSYYSHELKYDSHHNCIEDRTHITGALASKPDTLCRYIITYK